MKKIGLRLLALGMVFGLTACGTPAPSSDEGKIETKETTEGQTEAKEEAPAEDITLTFWASQALVSEAEKKMAQEDWYVSQVARKFEAENPGVKVEVTVVPDQSAAHQTFKAAASTDSGPDIVNLWSGQSIFTMSDIILDITDMIPQEDKDNLFGWETATIDFKEGGKIIGYPVSGQEVCGFIYNKQILSEAGLDFDNNPPKTTEEFISAMEKIKAIGKIPIVASDAGWNGAYFTSFASLWVQGSGSEMVASDSTGATKFSDDKAFLDSYRFTNELFKKGLINEDYMTIPNADELFLNEEAALVGTGNWTIAAALEILGEENIGFCGLPALDGSGMTAIGGPGQVLVVSKNSKHPEMAVKFCSFMNNKENQMALLKNLSKFPTRTDITLEEVGMSGIQAYEQAQELASQYVYWADNSMLPEVNAEMQRLGGMAITGKMTVEEMAAELDKKASELQ